MIIKPDERWLIEFLTLSAPTRQLGMIPLPDPEHRFRADQKGWP